MYIFNIKADLIRIWYHENMRVFHDRLIDDADRKAMNSVYDKWVNDSVTRTLNNMFNNLSLADFKLSSYNSHPAIKAPLNN
jgi:predicted component of type VI protein secretion system